MLGSSIWKVAVTAAVLLPLSMNVGCRGGDSGDTSPPDTTAESCNEADLMAAATTTGPGSAILAHCKGIPAPVEALLRHSYGPLTPAQRNVNEAKGIDPLINALWPAWEKLCPGLTKHSVDLCIYPPGKGKNTCNLNSRDAVGKQARELIRRCELQRHGLFSNVEVESLQTPHEGLLALSVFGWLKRSGVSAKGAGEVSKALIGTLAAVGCGKPASAKCVKSIQNANFWHPELRVRQGPDMRLPTSRSGRPLAGSVAVKITKTSLLIEGKEVVPIECTTAAGRYCAPTALEAPDNAFHIDRAYKTDGAAMSWLIEPLRQKLSELMKDGKSDAKILKRPFEAVVTFTVDHKMPFGVVQEAAYTAKMAGLTQLRFAVLNPTDIRSPLKVIPISIQPAVASKAPPLKLAVHLKAAGLELSANPAHQKTWTGLMGSIPVGSGGKYAFHELYNRLRKLSARFPQEQTLTVMAAKDVPWQQIVNALDAGRTLLTEDAYQSAEAYRNAKVAPAKPNSKRRPAFPTLVLMVAPPS